MAAAPSGQSVFRGRPLGLETLSSQLGIDLLSFVNASIFIFAVWTSVRSALLSLYRYAERTFLVSVVINEQDAIYREVLRWMDDFQFRNRDFLSVKAVSSSEDALHNVTVSTPTTKDDHTPYPKFSHVTPSVKMEPFQGSRIFRFQGRLMLFKHSSPNADENNRHPQFVRRCYIEIQSLSLSLKPIRQFLETVRSHSREVSVSSTSIWRPISQGRDIVWWKKITSRPARDLSTVIIDRQKKQSLLDDINEYLQPQTRRWYSNHGIPYRRGYLFAGPPGTGKTSLASGLAGAFGLDIYVLSLSDPEVNESKFQKLLSEVPSRCIVLLEDIDVAGIARRPIPAALTTASEPRSEAKSDGNTTGISLSCLLNAVDGVSSQEGRILIMSTNAPESLDKALTRPGRVDFHLSFELPSEQQLRDLFLSIYSDMLPGNIAEEKAQGDKSRKGIGEAVGNEHDPSGVTLDELANRFANKVPAQRFSAAEVQGFLLNYKRKPEAACENVSCWVEQEGDRSLLGFTEDDQSLT